MSKDLDMNLRDIGLISLLIIAPSSILLIYGDIAPYMVSIVALAGYTSVLLNYHSFVDAG